MSHELRTPLNAILGFSEVMKSEVFGPHAVPTYKEYAADIHNSGVHLLNLINEILDLSRIEAGRYELNEEPTDLAAWSSPTATTCCSCARATAASRSTRLFEPDLPRLWADERACRQICLNLLSNAIKFTPQGGEIWLKVGWTAAGGQYMSVQGQRPRHSGRRDPDRARLVRPGHQRDQVGRAGHRPRPADRQEPGRPARRHASRSNPSCASGTEVIVTFPAERVMSALGPLEDPAPPTQPRAGGAQASIRRQPLRSAS